MSVLNNLAVTNSGSNPGITCVPACTSSLTSGEKSVPSTLCPTVHETALCGIVAATLINTIIGFSMWSCTTLGYASSSICSWNGVICIGSNVVSISLDNIGLSGMMQLY